MSFNSTIDIGDMLKFAGMLLAALWFIFKMSGRLDMVTGEIKALKDIVARQNDQLVAFTKALIDLARQEERINALDMRVEDLRKGRGWIQSSLDGEYPRTK